MHGVVALLAEVPMAEVALQLFLQAAYAASEVAHRETLAYELFEQVCAGTALHVAGLTSWVSAGGCLPPYLNPGVCSSAGHALPLFRPGCQEDPHLPPNAMQGPSSAQAMCAHCSSARAKQLFPSAACVLLP